MDTHDSHISKYNKKAHLAYFRLTTSYVFDLNNLRVVGSLQIWIIVYSFFQIKKSIAAKDIRLSQYRTIGMMVYGICCRFYNQWQIDE